MICNVYKCTVVYIHMIVNVYKCTVVHLSCYLVMYERSTDRTSAVSHDHLIDMSLSVCIIMYIYIYISDVCNHIYASVCHTQVSS